jgi:hypothetical protein
MLSFRRRMNELPRLTSYPLLCVSYCVYEWDDHLRRQRRAC